MEEVQIQSCGTKHLEAGTAAEEKTATTSAAERSGPRSAAAVQSPSGQRESETRRGDCSALPKASQGVEGAVVTRL